MIISTVCIGVWQVFRSHENLGNKCLLGLSSRLHCYSWVRLLSLLGPIVLFIPYYCNCNVTFEPQILCFCAVNIFPFKYGYKRYEAEKRYKLSQVLLDYVDSCANHAYLLWGLFIWFNLNSVLSLLLSYILKSQQSWWITGIPAMAQFTLSYKLQTDFSKSVTGIGLSAVIRWLGKKTRQKLSLNVMSIIKYICTLLQCHHVYKHTVCWVFC